MPIDISDALFRSPASITSLINTMEKDGLVKRKSNKRTDGRSIQVSITGKGRKTLDKLEPILEEIVKTVMSPLTIKKSEAIKKDLKEVRTQLAERTGAPRTWRQRRK